MNCRDQGTWQAFLDNEVSAAEKEELQRHLDTCAPCAATLSELTELEHWSNRQVTAYQQVIETEAPFPPATALPPFQPDKLRAPLPKDKQGGTMMTTQWKKWLSVAAAAALVTGALTVAPVQQAVADFLSLFRVQKLQVVQVSPEQINDMAQAVKSKVGQVDLKQFGQVDVLKKPEENRVSPAKATELLPFAFKQPAFLPDGFNRPIEVAVSSEGRSEFRLDVAQVNNLLKGMGATTLLPESLQGKAFGLRIPASARNAFVHEGNHSRINLSQFSSPELTVPAGVNPRDLRAALLDFPLLPQDVRTQLAGIEDWQHTMVVPDVDGSVEKVDINGAEGVYSVNKRGISHLFWVDQGALYQMNGPVDKDTLLKVARSLK
ncbi:DUF4367 domain-containing protein [Heliobacterium undosum]|uniref:Anti-sigma-W factor RsiW n=1 Tax=Heliomicrobium undosum TaxID=121734 RepID=A0A845L547_9FIRM|nr:zf-HC2 domain-containing protein [Heliomicrobium undosum]MZP30349.1 DUF4367 domain-containing protein [Heliomicrobium undosum]